MDDKLLLCADCHEHFAFKVSEQVFYSERGLLPPKRCKECRVARKQRRRPAAPSPTTTSAFPDEPASGVRIPGGARDDVGPREPARGTREIHEIECSDCGVRAQVPFRPIQGRAVFCQPCYQAHRGSVRQATDGTRIDDGDDGIVE